MTDERASLSRPRLRQVVLDTEDARTLAEFYHHLTGLPYLADNEPPAPGEPDPLGADWLVLVDESGVRQLAFQQVASMAAPTWPEGPRPQMLHLDFSVDSLDSLRAGRDRALELGASILEDRFDDPEENLIIFADPSGHPFCIFVPGE